MVTCWKSEKGRETRNIRTLFGCLLLLVLELVERSGKEGKNCTPYFNFPCLVVLEKEKGEFEI